MTAQPSVALEAVAEDRRHRRIAVREREQAIAGVAGGKHAVGSAQPPRAPPVVRDGDDAGDAIAVAGLRPLSPGREQKILQTPQYDRKPRSPSQGDDSRNVPEGGQRLRRPAVARREPFLDL